MYQFILLIHVLAAICIIALVLVQQGKGATMGAAFGSGASQTVFGSRGSGSFLFRVTLTFVALFFATSIGLNYLAVHAYKQEKVFNLPVGTAPAQTLPTLPTNNTQESATPAVPAKNDSGLNQPILPSEIPTRR